jgi:hypothetical protein
MKCSLKQEIIHEISKNEHLYGNYKLAPKDIAKLKTIGNLGKIKNFQVEEIEVDKKFEVEVLEVDENSGSFKAKVSFIDIEDKNAISVVREVKVKGCEKVEEAVKKIYPNAKDIEVWGKEYNAFTNVNSYLVSFFIVIPTDSNQVDCPTKKTKVYSIRVKDVEDVRNGRFAKYNLDPVEIAKILTLNDFGKVENLKVECYKSGEHYLSRVEFIDIPDKDPMLVKEIKVTKGKTIEEVVKQSYPNAKDIIVWAHSNYLEYDSYIGKYFEYDSYIVSFSKGTS